MRTMMMLVAGGLAGIGAVQSAVAQCTGVAIREDFRLGLRPQGDRGRLRDAQIHDGISGYWAQIPGVAEELLDRGREPFWYFAASSVDPLEWPEDPANPDYNGTAFGDHGAAAVIPYTPALVQYSVSIDAVPIYGFDDGILVGFTSSAATGNNFATGGELWVRYSGKGEWQLHSRTGGVLASGPGQAGSALTGFTPVTLVYDPAARWASVLINSHEVGAAVLAADPAFAYAGFEADAPFTNWQVVNHFTVREGPLSLFTSEPADASVSEGGVLSLIATTGLGEYRAIWPEDGGLVQDGPGAFGMVSAATTLSLTISDATAAAAGRYECIIVSPCGSWTSRVAVVAVGGCPADFNGDGFLDFFDSDAFVACFEGVECPPGKDADFNHDGFVDFFDADSFVEAFEAGC